MCEFFYIQSKDGYVTESDLQTLLTEAERASAENPHGTGVFNEDGLVFRTERALDPDLSDRIATLFAGSKKVVVHLRMATQGTQDITNVHPFTDAGLTLAHNGQVHGVEDHGELGDADSKMFLHKITDQDGDVIEKVQGALETTGGWFSIFLLNRDTSNLYYFRDGADMHFIESEQYVVGATKKKRLPSGKTVQKPDTGVLYRLDDDGPVEVTEFSVGMPRHSPVRSREVHYRQRRYVVHDGSDAGGDFEQYSETQADERQQQLEQLVEELYEVDMGEAGV